MKKVFLLARAAACMVSACYITSCQTPEESMSVNAEHAARSQSLKSEEAYPGENGTRKEAVLLGQKISYQEINNQAVFQNDIILTPGQLNASGANARTEAIGTGLPVKRWPGGIVPYTIVSSISNKQPILDAIADIESKTSIRFVQRGVSPYRVLQPNYVTFGLGRGPSSSLGMVGGQQYINAGIFPSKGAVIHEICHTLGLLHEHTRADRDNLIKIQYANVSSDNLLDFATFNVAGLPGLMFKNMDLGSVMMVDSYTGSTNGQPTITLLNNQPYTIQRNGLSVRDAECINAMYATFYMMGSGKLSGHDDSKALSVVISEQFASSFSVTSDADFVYSATTTGALVKTHKVTGSAQTLIANNFVTRAMTMYKGNIYAISGEYLLRINPATGASTQVGGKVWLGATAMTYINGFLFVVNGNGLFRVTPETGVLVQIGSGFYNCRELTARNNKIWALLGTSIYSIDPMTGAMAKLPVNKTFSWDAQITSLGTSLYVWESTVLYRISMSSGEITTISTGWGYINQMTANDYID